MSQPHLSLKSFLFLTLLLPITFTLSITNLTRFNHLYDDKPQEPSEPSPFLQALEPYISETSYYGDWMPINGQKIEGFRHHSGFARLLFSKILSPTNLTFHELVLMSFFDGIHTDTNYIMLILPGGRPEPTIDLESSKLIYKNLPAILLRDIVGFQECAFDMSFSFTDAENGHAFDVLSSDPKERSMRIQLMLESSVCGIRIVTSPMTPFDPIINSQIVPYSLFAIITILANILGYIFLHFKIKHSPISTLDLSISTLYFLATFDIFLGLDHILSLTHTHTRFVSVKNILQIIGISYIAPAILLGLALTFRMKTKIMGLPWNGVIKNIFTIAVWFLPLNFIVFIMIFGAVLSPIRSIYYVFLTLFLLPHIIQNAILNRKHRWNYWYIGAMFLPKIMFMFYNEGYSHNLFRKTPHGILCLIIAIIIGIQITILAIQTEFPRLWVKVSRPYEVIKSTKCATDECPICLQGFNTDPSIVIAKTVNNETDNGSSQLVVTPCKHEFHMKCLRDWLLYEPKCPYCRTALPFSLDFEDFSIDNIV